MPGGGAGNGLVGGGRAIGGGDESAGGLLIMVGLLASPAVPLRAIGGADATASAGGFFMRAVATAANYNRHNELIMP